MTNYPINRVPAAIYAMCGTPLRAPSAKPRTIDDIPVDKVAGMAARLFMLLNLAWDYVETIQQIAKTLHPDGSKRISRRISELRRIYEQRRSYSLRDSEVAKERHVALLFEELCKPHLRKLHYSLVNEIQKTRPGISPDEMNLSEAVNTALAVLDAVKLYGDKCDAYIKAQGVEGHSILTDELYELRGLLPRFAENVYVADGTARGLTARILFNEIQQIDLIDEKGKEL